MRLRLNYRTTSLCKAESILLLAIRINPCYAKSMGRHTLNEVSLSALLTTRIRQMGSVWYRATEEQGEAMRKTEYVGERLHCSCNRQEGNAIPASKREDSTRRRAGLHEMPYPE